MTKISVITPSFNSEKFIRECMDSVIAQGQTNLEHIIIDDCSSDHSTEIIEDYCSLYNHIKLIKNKVNSGPATSRNNGLNEATGNVICFLDADDIWLEGKLDTQLEILQKKKFPIICGGYIKFGQGINEFTVIHQKLQQITFERMKYSNWIYTSSVMIDLRVTGKFKMNPELYYDDYACWVELIRKHGPAYYLQTPLIKYRVTKGSVSRNKIKSALKTLQVYSEVFELGLIKKYFYFMFYIYNGFKKSKG